MLWHGGPVRLHPGLIALLVPALLLGTPSPASAAAGEVGYDVSYPQCGTMLPTDAAFGIVGVTGNSTDGGRPFSTNPCLATQAAWAAATGEWGLYTNTANPGTSSPNWPAAGVGFCATGALDAGCAYEYGRKAAADAVQRAQGALAGTGLDPLGVTWWLDVEGSRTPGQDGNSWVGSGVVNAADLQGFADGLRQAGIPEVGVYSTRLQWDDITSPGYHRSTSASYRAQWPAGMARYPVEDGPVWFAGATDLASARAKCGEASFTGGERLLVQYKLTFDNDYQCADPDLTAPTATTTGPTAPVSTASTIRVAWSGTDTGGSGLASYDLRTTRSAADGSFGAWSEPVSMQRLLTTYKDVSRPADGWTACFTSRTRDAAGNVSPWATTMRCTTVPLDDRALASSSGWTRGSTSGWYRGTSTSTTRYGATLSRTNLVTKRLHLLALRCPTCGRVAVYAGGTLVGTVNLSSASTGRITVALPLLPKAVRTTVTLKVVTSGKLVRVDGLASSSR